MFRRPDEKLRVSGFCGVAGTFSSDPVLKKQYIRWIKCGFSLIELLIVIAVIAAIVAVAIPTIANITSAATGSKNVRNAQTIVSTFNAARAAGFNANTANAAAAIAFVSGTNAIIGTGTGSGGNGMGVGITIGGLAMSTNNITAASALIINSGGTTNMTLLYLGGNE